MKVEYGVFDAHAEHLLSQRTRQAKSGQGIVVVRDTIFPFFYTLEGSHPLIGLL
jgi:hypothetical protein